MEQDFDLVINEVSYRVTTPPRERVSRVSDRFHLLLINSNQNLALTYRSPDSQGIGAF